MRLFIAGIYTAGFEVGGKVWSMLNEREQELRLKADNLLESYHFIGNERKRNTVRAGGKKVFLDSGAFSAFTQGAEIDLNEYVKFCRDNEDFIEMASVLDGIGDPQKTYENQIEMERQGVCPLPCFHYGEDERYLEWYIENYTYITIGGLVPISKPEQRAWLDKIWSRYLCDENGRPKLKVHGFGLTTVDMMSRYPWHSVDSSTWIQKAMFGMIRHFGTDRDITVSKESPRKKVAGQHFENFPQIEREQIRADVEALGFDVERLRDVYASRWAYNLNYFIETGKRLAARPDVRFQIEQESIF